MNKKPFNLLLMKCFYIIASLIFVNCSTNTVNYDQKLENIPFIPLPQVIESSNLFISVSELSSIQTEIKSERIEAALKDFTNFWEQQTSNEIVINPNLNNSLKSIHLDLDYNSETSKEFYQLEINEKGIIIKSNTEEGLYRGLTTLKQVVIFSSNDLFLTVLLKGESLLSVISPRVLLRLRLITF